MTSRKLLQQAFGLTLIVLLLAGCGGAQADLTATPVPPTLTTAGPTATPVPPTATPISFKEAAPECEGVTSAIQVPAHIPLEPDVPTWLPVTNPTASGLAHIDLASPSTGWAVGAGGIILHLKDGIWTEEAGPIDEDLISIDAISEDEAYAVSKTGKVLAYDGQQWTLLNSTPLPTDEVEAAQFLSKADGWAAYIGEDNISTIARFSGSQWETEFESQPRSGRYGRVDVVDFSMISSEKGWAMGEPGSGTAYVLLFWYQNGQWTYEEVEEAGAWGDTAIDVNEDNIGWVIEIGGDRILKFEAGMLRQVDSTGSWDIDPDLRDIVTLEDGSGIAFGQSILLLAEDSITEWSEAPSEPLRSLAFTGEHEAWAINASGNLLHYAAPGIIAPPVAPELSEIENPGGNYRFAIAWSEVDDATAYELEQADETGCPQVAYYGSESSANIAVRETGDHLYRVRAVGLGGSSPWSEVQKITVREEPPPCGLECAGKPGLMPNDAPSLDVEITCESGQHTQSVFSWTDWVDDRGLVHYFEGTRTYENTGNEYKIVADASLYWGEDGSIQVQYHVEVTGGVFGDTPETCRAD